MAYLEKIYIDIIAGTDIRNACEEAKALTIKRKATVFFNFNGVEMEIQRYTKIDESIQQYYKKLKEEK